MSIEIEKPERFYEHARRSIDAYRYSFFLNKEDTFRVLCGKFHVVTMTKALWIYHLVSIILVTITFFYEYLIYLWPTWLLVFFSGYPIYRQKASWMWPFIIYVGLTTVMFILFGAYLFFYSIFIRRTQKTESIFDSTTCAIFIHLANLIFCLFHLWQFPVVNRARKFFKNKDEVTEKIPFGFK